MGSVITDSLQPSTASGPLPLAERRLLTVIAPSINIDSLTKQKNQYEPDKTIFP
jgi:hypothetical protein